MMIKVMELRSLGTRFYSHSLHCRVWPRASCTFSQLWSLSSV